MDVVLAEADVHVLNKDLDDEETEAKFPAIKRKYRMKELSLVVDSETEGEMKVHAHGEINPEGDGVSADKDKEEEEAEENGKYANEADIQPFLNKPAPISPPTGYEYYDNKNGSLKIRRLRGNAKPSSGLPFVPLSIKTSSLAGHEGASGIEHIIIKGLNKHSNRISSPGKLANNMGAKKIDRVNHQFHHIIPDAVVRENGLMSLARTKISYDLDRADNGLKMPCNEVGQKVTNLPIHRGSHGGYNSKVNEELNTTLGELIIEHKGKENIPVSDIQEWVEHTELRFRQYASTAFPKLS